MHRADVKLGGRFYLSADISPDSDCKAGSRRETHGLWTSSHRNPTPVTDRYEQDTKTCKNFIEASSDIVVRDGIGGSREEFRCRYLDLLNNPYFAPIEGVVKPPEHCPLRSINKLIGLLDKKAVAEIIGQPPRSIRKMDIATNTSGNRSLAAMLREDLEAINNVGLDEMIADGSLDLDDLPIDEESFAALKERISMELEKAQQERS